MNSHTVIITNESTVLTDTEVQAAIPAFQYQVAYHFKAFWNIGAVLHWLPKGSTLPKGAWQIVILDDADQANALGYHELTVDNKPSAKVFAKTDKDNGYLWTVTLTHELLELLADPWINLAAQVSNTRFYGWEVGDPVEADKLGYKIGSVVVSDFITPQWFQPGVKGPFDYAGHCTKPLQILPGGYMSIFDAPGGSWSTMQMKGDKLEVVDTYHGLRIRHRS